MECYCCRNTVKSNENEDVIYFCSKYCLKSCKSVIKNDLIYKNSILNKKIVVTFKICSKCSKEIHTSQPTYHSNDKIYCSEHCRNYSMYVDKNKF